MKHYSDSDIQKLREQARETDLIIYRSDTRNAAFFVCSRMREWLARYDFPLERMLTEGIPAIELLDKSNNDLVALMATEAALLRRSRGITDIIERGA